VLFSVLFVGLLTEDSYMGVRNIFPGSIAFAVTILTHGKSLRVEIVLDLQERLILVPTGILPEILDRLGDFAESLSEIAANTLAAQKWDGTDPLTEYQSLRILPHYQITRSHLRFSILLDEAMLLPLGELERRSVIRL
jgi:hypothetical protein